MSDESDLQYSDDDVDDNKHARIIENILNLNKVQHLKKPSRTEPTLQISEFNLVKSITGKKGSIQLDELAKTLKKQKKHIQIGKKLESTKKAHTLPKPLEKPQAKRIRRSIGYERNRFQFDRWEAFITSNRSQAHQVFPLDSVEKINLEVKQAKKLPETWKIKSELEQELEKLEIPIIEHHIEEKDENEFPSTLKELKEKRKEAAKLRAHQSYKEAKARKRNKIKSKRYHRILRKEKIKLKLKEFEELQKVNPEQALNKLEEIERVRALERFSLRHKSTGKWARSKQIRAKYDKESRQVLAQQLQISRDLTHKLKNPDNDSEEEGFQSGQTIHSSSQNEENPWVNGLTPSKEISEFVSGYKKFWIDQNEKVGVKGNEKEYIQGSGSEENTNTTTEILKKEMDDHLDQNNSENETKRPSETVDQKVQRTSKKEDKNTVRKIHRINKKKDHEIKKNSKQKLAKKMKKCGLNIKSGNWELDDIFQEAEKKIDTKLKHKFQKDQNKTKKKLKVKSKKNLRDKKYNGTIKVDLSMPLQSKKQIIDEEMIEKPSNDEENDINVTKDFINLKSILDSNSKSQNSPKSEDIDIEKFAKPKPTDLDSTLPDLLIEDENTEDNSQKKIIMEAFEDEDIIEDFSKEKQEEVDKGKSKDIDLNLPGWGSWAGAGINPKNQRKRKRFIVRMPEVMPRRDDNRGSLIINEKASSKLKLHLVSEVPFPFKTVKDYEASIRTPIGNTFVPETAFRKFIKPAVETKMGAIIEPVTKSILMGKKRN